MSLIKRIFGNPKDKDAPAQEAQDSPLSQQFQEDDDDSSDNPESRSAQRREVVQVMLRDTMRMHGIPSDWIEARTLSATTRTRRSGLHVQFVVKQAHDRLLSYVFAFQDSFMREMSRFDSRVEDWLLSISWQFDGYVAPQKTAVMPDPKSWTGQASSPVPMEGAAVARAVPPGPVAIAPSAAPVAAPTDHVRAFANTQDPDAQEEAESMEADLAALFAIRDAALAQPSEPPPDFEPTRPGFEDTEDPNKR